MFDHNLLLKNTKPKQKNLNMKIFNNNITKNSKLSNLNTIETKIGNPKILPAYTKEWKNTIYSFNKSNLINLPFDNIFINKIIKMYFDMFLTKYTARKRTIFKRSRIFLNKIYISNIDVKHTNQKAKITLYTLNKEREYLKNNYLISIKLINKVLIKRYIYLYKLFLSRVIKILSIKINNLDKLSPKSWAFDKKFFFFFNDKIMKSEYIKYKLEYLHVFIILNRLFLEKMWNNLVKIHYSKSIKILQRFDLFYSLNSLKFNKKKLLPKLSKILLNIVNKNKSQKIEYNIVNIKSLTFNSDIFTNICATMIKKKVQVYPLNYINHFIRRIKFPKTNTIIERARILSAKNKDLFRQKYKDLRVLSNIHVNTNNNLSKLLTNIFKTDYITNNYRLLSRAERYSNKKNSNTVKNTVFKSINYKNIAGVRFEVKGRLSKRFRADRAAYFVKWKYGLKNIYSSYKGLSAVLLRGDVKPQVSNTIVKSKRRIGAFAVKGWIAGK